jgi:glycosyltransferase involved in cell wall biosynthesis
MRELERVLHVRTDGPESRALSSPQRSFRVAILIPCYNESATIQKVVADFRQELPEATIYVYDNNSDDGTGEIARDAGAVVVQEPRQGKGFVVQAMFRDIDADIYVLVDGDDTYPASEVHRLLSPIRNCKADMVVGARLSPESHSEFKPTNLLGNYLLRAAVRTCFRTSTVDLLSGYRAFSASFVRTMPLFGGGFEVETELTIKALQGGYRVVDFPISAVARGENSYSKIRHRRDGVAILTTILALFRDYRPLTFFGGAGLLIMLLALIPGSIVIVEYLETGLVQRLPSAVLAVAMVLAGMLLCFVGLILHAMLRRFQELDHLLRRSLLHSTHPAPHQQHEETV